MFNNSSILQKHPSSSFSGKRSNPFIQLDQDDAIPFSSLIEDKDYAAKRVKQNKDQQEEMDTQLLLTNPILSSSPILNAHLHTEENEQEINCTNSKNIFNNHHPLSPSHPTLKIFSSDNENEVVLNNFNNGFSEEEEFSRKDNRKNSEQLLFRKSSNSTQEEIDLEEPAFHIHRHQEASVHDQQCYYHDLRSEVEQMLADQNARLMKKKPIISTNTPFKCKCALNHTIETTYTKLKLQTRKFGQYNYYNNCGDNDDEDEEEDLNYQYPKRPQICNQCQPQFLTAQQYARQQKGILLSNITIKGGVISAKKILKQEFKEFLKSEEEKRQKEYEIKQEQLYRQARIQYKKSYQEDSDSSDNSDTQHQQQQYSPDAQKIIQAAKVVEEQLMQLALKKAQSFLMENKNEYNISEIEATEVYKMLLFPDQVLQCYFSVLDKHNLNKQYREYARNIHPDKNHHPDSSRAFQKLNQFYQNQLKKY